MRSYGQYCALARALDVVGDRWTLLIIRELISRDGRYSDLRDGLPGIATNLLADRLRQLQVHGVVESYDAPPPVRATVYRLTRRGRELGDTLRALVAWGAPLLARGQGNDTFRTHWLALVLPILFEDVDITDIAPLTVLVNTGEEQATMEIAQSGVTMNSGSPTSKDAVIVEGHPDAVFAFLSGTADGRRATGVTVRGPQETVRRLRALTTRSILSTDRA